MEVNVLTRREVKALIRDEVNNAESRIWRGLNVQFKRVKRRMIRIEVLLDIYNKRIRTGKNEK